jgi:hypothetical protein
MARAYPAAPREHLAVIADWNTWLFLLDDQFDEGQLGREPEALQDYCATTLAILRGQASPQPGAAPAFQALGDLARRLHALAAPLTVERLTCCLEQSFRASLWEARNRVCARVPGEEEYRRYRPLAGAVYCYLTLIEFAAQMLLPDAIYAHPAISRLTTLTNQIICWANDVLSYPREHAAGNVHNLITVVQHSRSLDEASAIDLVVDLHNSDVRAFVDLSEAAGSWGDSQVRAYVQGLQWWLRANMDWSAATFRYR